MYHAALVCVLLILRIQLAFFDECGHRAKVAQEYVHYGNQANLGEWPWHVTLFHQMNQNAPSYACGGTLLSKNFVLTAGHCTYPQNKIRPLKAKEIFVRAGLTNLQTLESSLQQIAVAEILRHEDFSTGTLENDIALLKLVGEISVTDYVRPICFWSGDEDERLVVGKSGHIAGFGRDETNRLSDVLKSAVMPVVSRKDCRDSDPDYYTRYLYDRKTFCAGFRNGTSAGPGDSGGGLYLEVNGTWVVRGVVSNGKVSYATVIDTRSYVVFTDVAYFKTWIDLKLGGKDLADMVESPGEMYAACGQKLAPKSVRRGYREARPWPWKGDVFKVGYPEVALCDAAIINENFMVVPADAFSDQDAQNPSQFEVKFFVSQNTVLHSSKVRGIVRYEGFDPGTRWNNVALIELRAPLRFTEILRPICVRYKESMTSSLIGGYLADNMLISGTSSASCGQTLNVTQKFFCSRLTTKFHGTMPDLMYDNVLQNAWVLRGIVFNVTYFDNYWKSTGEHTRGFYTPLLNMTHYTSWIEENAVVKANNLLDLASCPTPRGEMYWISYQGTGGRLATLITPSLAVTVADYVDGASPSDLVLETEDEKEVSKISAVHIHPKYSNVLLTANIAIVELSQPLSTPPICLPRTNAKLSPALRFQTMAEEGSDSGLYYGGVYVGFEYVPVNVTLTNVQHCAREWSRGNALVDTTGGHICGHMFPNMKRQPPCSEDYTGTPLFYHDDSGATYLRGVLDMNKKNHCDSHGPPEVYIDVMHYAEWIAEVAAGNTSDVGFGGKPNSRSWRIIP